MHTWTLLRLKFSLFAHSLLRGGRKRLAGQLVLGGLLIYLGVGLLHGMMSAMRLLGSEFAATMLTGAFVAAMLLVGFWAVGTMLNLLYLRSDVELLLATPVSLRSLFVAKSIDALLAMPFPIVLSLIVSYSYGAALGASWLYYGVATLAALASVALAVLVSMMVTIVLMRYLPQQRAQGLWMLIWALIFGLGWLAWMLLSNQPAGMEGMMQQLSAARLSRLQALGWTPAGWAASLCVAWLRESWGGVLLNAASLAISLALAYALGQRLFARAFYEGWSRAMTVPTRSRCMSVRAAHPRHAALPERLLPPQMRAIAQKDWRSLVRDMRRLAGLILPLLMGGVYSYLISRSVPATGEVRFWLAFALLPLALLFSALALTAPSLAQEGGNIALLCAAPLPAARLLWAKAWASFGLIGILAVAMTPLLLWFVAGTLQGVGLALAFALYLALGLALIGVGCAALAPRYHAPTDRRALGIVGSYSFLILAALFSLLSLATWICCFDMIAPDAALLHSLRGALGGVMPWRESVTRSRLTFGLLSAAHGVLGLGIAGVWRYGIRKLERLQITDLES